MNTSTQLNITITDKTEDTLGTFAHLVRAASEISIVQGDSDISYRAKLYGTNKDGSRTFLIAYLAHRWATGTVEKTCRSESGGVDSSEFYGTDAAWEVIEQLQDIAVKLLEDIDKENEGRKIEININDGK